MRSNQAGIVITVLAAQHLIQRLIIPDVGKLKDTGLIPDSQRAFAGRKININEAVEVGVLFISGIQS